MIDLVTKEVAVAKKRVVKMIYQELKKSHLNGKTKMYIQLLSVLDMKKSVIMEAIADLRAEHLRHLMQEGVMNSS